jgi:hypothetical protein
VVAQNRSHHEPRHNRSNNQDRAEIHSKLNEAARIAKAAEACALAGSVAEIVSISMDIASMSARRCSEVADGCGVGQSLRPALFFTLRAVYTKRPNEL